MVNSLPIAKAGVGGIGTVGLIGGANSGVSAANDNTTGLDVSTVAAVLCAATMAAVIAELAGDTIAWQPVRSIEKSTIGSAAWK
ncbi:MAG: hypothetical protein KDD75_08860 [Caldilineaceae bacterium]|nr:hypothetical protein [Caldilineaceae bacterium]